MNSSRSTRRRLLSVLVKKGSMSLSSSFVNSVAESRRSKKPTSPFKRNNKFALHNKRCYALFLFASGFVSRAAACAARMAFAAYALAFAEGGNRFFPLAFCSRYRFERKGKRVCNALSHFARAGGKRWCLHFAAFVRLAREVFA